MAGTVSKLLPGGCANIGGHSEWENVGPGKSQECARPELRGRQKQSPVAGTCVEKHDEISR